MGWPELVISQIDLVLRQGYRARLQKCGWWGQQSDKELIRLAGVTIDRAAKSLSLAFSGDPSIRWSRLRAVS